MTGRNDAMMSKRAPLSERGDDLYQSPPEAVWALLRAEMLPMDLWEPACGPGAIVRELRSAGHDVLATDLVDYGWDGQDASGRDFLMEREKTGRAVVTNPPFKLAAEFVEKALDLGAPKVVMLLRLAFLESDRRSAILDGGRLRRVHVFRKRLPGMHREGWEGRKANSGMAFAWFVWERDRPGPTELRRLSWDRGS